MTTPTPNTLIYAITGFKLFAEPVKTSYPVYYATDKKGEYRPWDTKDPVGETTGEVIRKSDGTWVELITRVWKQRTFDQVRVNRNAWFRLEDGNFYDGTGAKAVEEKSLQTKLLEAYDSLEKQYQAIETYTNDAGKTMLVFANGNRVSLDEYEKLSLVEKRNYALPKANGVTSDDTPTPKTETAKNGLPTWAIALLVAAGTGLLGFLGYTIITKSSKNGKSKKR